MHAKLIACVFSASLVVAAPHQRRSPMPIAQEDVQNDFVAQPIDPNEFLANFAQFFPQMVQFFSNPENLQIFSDPAFNNGQNPEAQDPNNVGAGVGAENGEVPPPIAEEANIDNEIPPPPPPPENEDSGDDSDNDGPSTAAQIGNFAGDVITGDDGTGDLIGAGVGLIEDIFF